MDKQNILQQLQQLTTTEEIALKKTQTLPYNYEDFKKIYTEKNEPIYQYTFEKHLSRLIRKRPQDSGFLKTSQLLILKHARFSSTPLHQHDFIEMNYVFSGTVTIMINEKKVILKAGDFCLLDTGVIHQIIETNQDDIVINFLISKEYFSTQMLSRLASNSMIADFAINALSESQKHNQYLVFETSNNDYLIDAIFGVLAQFFNPSFGSHEVIHSYMIIIFSELVRNFQEKQRIESQNSDQLYLGEVLDYLEKHFATCTLASVAETFGYNPSYLSRRISQQLGRSFVTILQELKLNQASLLLRSSSLPVEQIAHQVGYKNVSFFYKLFQKKYQCSPHAYRQN